MKTDFRTEEQAQELEAAGKLWRESEWRLGFLRTETGTGTKEPNDEEILLWYQRHQK